MTASLIQLSSEGDKAFRAYLAVPDQPSGHAVVILQEIFGINANIRGIADEYAAAGYVTIAPDLFWRQERRVEPDPATDRERATALMKGLNQAQAIDDSLAAAAYLRRSKNSSGKTGAVGYCLGGRLAFFLATRLEIAAAVSYYGVAIESVLDRVDELDAPLLLHHRGGPNDASFTRGVRSVLCSPQGSAFFSRPGRVHDVGTDHGSGSGRRGRHREKSRVDGGHRSEEGRARNDQGRLRRQHRRQRGARLG